MKIILDIYRTQTGAEKGSFRSFEYETVSPLDSVATALTRLNERRELRDINGAPASPVRWECNCLQKKCGACAMVINGRPALACDVKLSECKKRVRLEPLKKFPVIEDLLVDRRQMMENLRAIRAWLESDAMMNEGVKDNIYEASRCLQCGCCLEVCPNFYPGGDFMGMAAGVPISRILSEAGDEQMSDASALYSRHIYNGCGKSLACRNVCPAGIDIDSLLVNSNAAAVWKRLFSRKKKGKK